MEKIWRKSYVTGVPHEIRFEEITLPAALSRSAARYRDTPALVFQGTEVTFHQLDEMASRFASALKSLGVKPGDRVGILLPNLIQTAVAVYGALRLGATVCMHNPRSDDMPLRHQLTDAEPRVLVCLDVLVPRILEMQKRTKLEKIVSCHIRDYLPFLKKQLFPLVKTKLHLKTPQAEGIYEFTKLMESSEPIKETKGPGLDDTAFILYTSATTGIPKGVPLSHRNLSYNTQQVRAWFPTFKDGREKVVGCLPFFHVFGLTCALNIGIFYGFTDILVPLPEPKNIAEAAHSYQASFIPALPTLYTAYVNDPSLTKYSLKAVKGCFSGGAPLALGTIRQFEKMTGAQICEGYGLTESSPVTHINPYGGKTKVGTIGLPLPETDAKIMDLDDPAKEITAPGVPGELWVTGPQIMQGYLNLAKETQATLKDGWLATGDIATMDFEGFFSIIARKKDMIVCEGQRIYPRDVEEVIFSHPKIQEACAIGIEGPGKGEVVKAFVVLKKGETASEQDIMAHCRRKLAPHQMPTSIDFLDEMPRNPVGKTQRRELKRLHLLRKYKAKEATQKNG
ncbi:MAG: long-chain-fatty-acid--CoA ligase [Thermodesulfobacteriota bacterium]